ncbi:glycosyltransferase family 1 protein [Clostridium botulinum]|nr:glycosyltransferase family 1 protein [Clostridium botulinum]
MRILVINTVNFAYGGGISNVIMNYYRAIDKSDMKIDFVACKDIDRNLKNELECNGSKVYHLNSRMKKPFKYILNLIKIIKNGKYDIVHAHGNSCTLALEMYSAKKGGAKVRIPHSHNSTCDYTILHRMLRKIFDASYTNAFACGKKAGEWLYNGKPFDVINNGIDIEKFKYNSEIREKYREKYRLCDKKVIGHIGHFSYQKNHDFLIKIFKELYKLDNKYRLLLIGDGELRSSIEQKINDLGLNDFVIFTGKSFEVPQLLQAMDILIMPSRFEGLPLTLIEAQASGLTCFVSDVVSNEVAITSLIKFLSLEKSPKEWAERINSMQIINRIKIKEFIYSKIVDSGYSIKENAINFKKMYKKYLKDY